LRGQCLLWQVTPKIAVSHALRTLSSIFKKRNKIQIKVQGFFIGPKNFTINFSATFNFFEKIHFWKFLSKTWFLDMGYWEYFLKLYKCCFRIFNHIPKIFNFHFSQVQNILPKKKSPIMAFCWSKMEKTEISPKIRSNSVKYTKNVVSDELSFGHKDISSEIWAKNEFFSIVKKVPKRQILGLFLFWKL